MATIVYIFPNFEKRARFEKYLKYNKHESRHLVCYWPAGILEDPGATSRDNAIFLGESLLQELKSPWELILTEPVPEVVEFRPAE